MHKNFKWYEEYKDWSCFDHALVQILVVVANSQVRTLIADVRKGFLAIVLNQELIDLKISPKGSIRKYFLMLNIPDYWKGNRLIFLYMVRDNVECSNIFYIISSGYVKVT